MAKPGVVLRRAIGSTDPFSEQPKLPKNLLRRGEKVAPAKGASGSHVAPTAKTDDKATKAAVVSFAREKRRRDRERERLEVADDRERQRRARAVKKAERDIGEARRKHDAKIKEIEDERSVLDRRLEAEETRWASQKAKLDAALREARGH